MATHLVEARGHYTTTAVVVGALAALAGALALALFLSNASLPFITPSGFMLTGGALLLTSLWLYGEGRAVERHVTHVRPKRS